MKLNLELNTLRSIMRDFYAVTKVRSSIYDGNYQKILSYPDEHTPPNMLDYARPSRHTCSLQIQ